MQIIIWVYEYSRMCIPHGFVFTFYSLFVDYWLFLSSLDFFLLFSFLLKLIFCCCCCCCININFTKTVVPLGNETTAVTKQTTNKAKQEEKKTTTTTKQKRQQKCQQHGCVPLFFFLSLFLILKTKFIKFNLNSHVCSIRFLER